MTYYDDISDGYEELHMKEQLQKIKLIKKYFNPNPLNKLLDVGCGTGLTTEPWNCKRFGVDPAKKLIERARQKKIIEYSVAPAEKIPYPDNYFDYVVSITAIQNFSDIKKGLNEIKRVGKESFVLTYLKRSQNAELIDNLINNIFNVKKRIEEKKDIIYFI
ncbi:methyltransferase domain-containing protein [archaeon]|jgi:ubiquinone/menaquinone biosynthesis C-methylase UbiE|nr:methyltransferase domain-containing protein [archaeon]